MKLIENKTFRCPFGLNREMRKTLQPPLLYMMIFGRYATVGNYGKVYQMINHKPGDLPKENHSLSEGKKESL
jgi:hypothetical protein